MSDRRKPKIRAEAGRGPVAVFVPQTHQQPRLAPLCVRSTRSPLPHQLHVDPRFSALHIMTVTRVLYGELQSKQLQTSFVPPSFICNGDDIPRRRFRLDPDLQPGVAMPTNHVSGVRLTV